MEAKNVDMSQTVLLRYLLSAELSFVSNKELLLAHGAKFRAHLLLLF